MHKTILKKGALYCNRLGPIAFKKQNMWEHRAPEAKGMWAFPYPYNEKYLNEHQYERLMPTDILMKKYSADEAEYELYNKWIHDKGENLLPLRKFYWEGLVYSHLNSKGVYEHFFEDYERYHKDDVMYHSAWYLTTVEEFVKRLNKHETLVAEKKYTIMKKFKEHRALSHDAPKFHVTHKELSEEDKFAFEIFLSPKIGKVCSF